MIPPLWSEGKDTALAETALHFKTRQTSASIPIQIKIYYNDLYNKSRSDTKQHRYTHKATLRNYPYCLHTLRHLAEGFIATQVAPLQLQKHPFLYLIAP